MRYRSSKIFVNVCLATATALLNGCPNPQQAAIKLLSQQGLVLLEPARDYVRVGGLVVLSAGGQRPVYLDPYSEIPPADPADFDALIPAQSMNDKAGLKVAMQGLASLVSLPIGLQFDSSDSVTIKQVDTGGQHLASPKVDEVIQSDGTKQKVISLLSSAQKKTRVFVVQDVFSAKSLTVASTSGHAVAASYGGDVKPVDCSSNKAQTGPPNDKAAQSPDKSANAQGNASAKKASSPKLPSVGAAALSVSVGACLNRDGSLSFTTDKEIPFAVRLNELQVIGGVVTVKYGNVTLGNSLGDPDLAKRTSVINRTDPVVHGLTHSTKQ